MREEITVNRNHKDKLFRRLFDGNENKENLLSLYNAVNNTEYTDVSALEITTLEDAIYLGMKNDVSFLIESTINVYEHQSSFCPNMPLRGLSYAAKLYEQYVDKNKLNVYGSRKIGIPIPKYMVFYNGEKNMPDMMKLKLSDMFEPAEKVSDEEFQWTATVLNVNAGHNKEIMERCKTLYGYAVFIGKIRQYSETTHLKAAVERAMNECIEADILTDFLSKHRSEVEMSILTEYDEQLVHKGFYEDGLEEGRIEGISLGLERGRNEGLDIGRNEGLDLGRSEGLELGLERGRTEGMDLGIERGLERGIQALIADNLEEGIPKARTIEKLKVRFDLTQEKAEAYFCKFSE